MNYMLISKTKEGTTEEFVSAKEAHKIASMATRNQAHLCWNCPNDLCNPIECPKVNDIEKKHIDEYEFINSGIQIISKDEERNKLLVYDCELYNRHAAKVKVKRKDK